MIEKSCTELEQVLTHVEEHCRIIINCLEEFNRYVGQYGQDRLTSKLLILACWIAAGAKSLYEKHQDQGYVAVLLNMSEGTNVYWVSDERVVADKAFYRAGGSIVLSVDELSELAFSLIRELVSGSWAKVVDWLNKYGKSQGLDFDKLP